MKLLGVILLITWGIIASAQELPLVNLSLERSSFTELVEQLETQTEYAYFFRREWVKDIEVSIQVENEPLGKVLHEVLLDTDLHFFIDSNKVYFTDDIKIIDKPKLSEHHKSKPADQGEIAKGLMFKREYLTSTIQKDDLADRTIQIGKRSLMAPGKMPAIAGYIKNEATGEALPGVLIYSGNPPFTAMSDDSGFYTISLPPGNRVINFQFMGSKPLQRKILLFSDGQFNIGMQEDIIALNEVVLESTRDANIESIHVGKTSVNIVEAKNVPIVMGERDVMKIATTLPGVQSVGEGAAGFNVRGGKADQNLILLDGYPLFNTSHFFGFFSVFNSEAISDMQIYKSSIPASLGGRLSSVMDIKSKRANRDTISGSGGISPITAKLTAEIPLFSKKAGLMAAVRTTYSDWVLNQVGNSEFAENDVAFSDVMIKYDHDFSENDRVELSGYLSFDKFKIASDTLFTFSDFKYDNRAMSAKYTHAFSRELSATLSAAYSEYGYDLEYNANPEGAFLQNFNIQQQILKGEFNHTQLEFHDLTGGFEIKKTRVNPGSQLPLGSSSLVKPNRINHEYGTELFAYISDQYHVTDKLSFYGGLRFSLFMNLGPGTVLDYNQDAPKNAFTVQGEKQYGKNDVVASYIGLEPRFSFRLKLDKWSSIKAAYNRSRQNIHTLTNSASVSPTDIWRLSSAHLKPQISDQYTMGYFRNFLGKTFETSVEVYYKNIKNLLDFKVGSDFLMNHYPEQVVLQGPGKSYGIEFSLKKDGKLNGWLNYTFARTFIQLDSEHPEERINNGTYYPANYDIPHTINLVANYKLTHRISASYNFVYKSGRPMTYPVGIYDFYRSASIFYSDRNKYRIPDYMRMDVGLNLEAGHRLNKLTYSYWSFSIYNLLGRDNPYSIFFATEGKKIKGYKLVVFGSPIPTISYNFKF